MANTTNFGWETPDDTDLVKDGAAAMRTLGNSIDTSFVDLKGGTTGQVLAKASNTDMDFSWVAQDDANAIQNTQLTAKGALITAFSSATPATLTVGTNGQVLTADSTTATGLAWAAASGGAARNIVINGAMDIWARGTSFNSFGSTSVYTADRYYAYRGALAAGLTVSRQVTSDTTNLPNIQYAARLQRDSGNTSTAQVLFLSDLESVNSIPLAGQTVVFSYYARAGANYSATSSAFSGTLVTGTGTDQALRSSYTGQTNAVSVSATLTTTWQRFQGTATLASTATQIGLNFNFTPTGTAGANDYVEITGVQIELGSVATKFQRNGSTIQGELAACQRYYYRQIAPTTSTVFGGGWASSTTVAKVQTYAPVTMRVAPTAIDYANIQLWDGGATYTITSFGLEYTSQNTLAISAGVSSATLTAYRPCAILSTSTSGYLGFSAEL